MIKSLILKNFQAHKDSTIEFNKGVNVIIGPSDSGKSSIIRALRWVFENRPMGGNFKNWSAGKKDTVEARVNFEEGTFISLIRAGETNLYYTSLDEENPLEALKGAVPEEVQTLTNFAEYNLHKQHDNYFLLEETGGEIARKMNSLVGIAIIDKMFSNLKSRGDKANAEVKRLTSETARLEGEINSLQYLDAVKEHITMLKRDVDEYNEGNERKFKLYKIICTLDDIEVQRDKCERVLKHAKEVTELNVAIEEYKAKEEARFKLSVLIDTITDIQGTLKEERGWLEVSTDYEAVNNLVTEYKKEHVTRNKLSLIIQNLEIIGRNIKVANGKLEGLVKDYVAKLKKAKLCPTCLTEIDAKVITKIEKELKK